ncbi:MAG: sulfotransferase domain-containing protein [Chloroflexi bacterium]|nr:sulfotransferase domain-containing protein [Chloroflexota bacterium]
MIVLSVGMPRAGSGWHYNLIHDLVVASGGKDAREIRRRYRLGRILTEVNCNIGALTTKRLLPVLLPALLGNTFTIKAHASPSPLARFLIREGSMRSAYIYRDPRAALLSAYENGQRGSKAFAQLTSIELAIDFMIEYTAIWEQWMAVEQAINMRYEDLLTSYDTEVSRLLDFLPISGPQAAIAAVIEKYRPGQVDKMDRGLHFQKGQPERFRSALSPEQLEACNQAFGPYLERMGYIL